MISDTNMKQSIVHWRIMETSRLRYCGIADKCLDLSWSWRDRRTYSFVAISVWPQRLWSLDEMRAIVASAVATVVTVNREWCQLSYSSDIVSVTWGRRMEHGHETVKCTWKKLFFIGTANVDSCSIRFGDTAVGTRIITSISVYCGASCKVTVSGGLPQ
jgi:hypothetical protein